MYIFDVHVGEHMMCVSVSVPVCSASPVCPVQCYQPYKIAFLTALLCKYVRTQSPPICTYGMVAAFDDLVQQW